MINVQCVRQCEACWTSLSLSPHPHHSPPLSSPRSTSTIFWPNLMIHIHQPSKANPLFPFHLAHVARPKTNKQVESSKQTKRSRQAKTSKQAKTNKQTCKNKQTSKQAKTSNQAKKQKQANKQNQENKQTSKQTNK